MRMKPDADAGHDVFIQEPVQMQQPFAVHQAVGVDHGYRIRLYVVHQRDQLEKLFIRIARDRHELGEHLVAQRLDLAAEFHRRAHLALFEDDADAVQTGRPAGGEVFDRAGPVVDHADDHGVLPVERTVERIRRPCVGENGAVKIKRPAVVQKADLDDVDIGVDKPFKDADDIRIPEPPVVDISAVAQRAVEEEWFHDFNCLSDSRAHICFGSRFLSILLSSQKHQMTKCFGCPRRSAFCCPTIWEASFFR